LRLEKSTIAAPTLDGIAVVRAQGSTLARMNPDPLHQPLPPRRHERLTDVVVAHMPPGSTVAPPQSLPRHRRAHLKGSLPRAPQGDVVALEPHGIRRRGRWHIAVVCTSWGRRRVRVLGIRCRAAPTSPPCAPQGSAVASVSPDPPLRHRCWSGGGGGHRRDGRDNRRCHQA
jgi:hypothetical protein